MLQLNKKPLKKRYRLSEGYAGSTAADINIR